MQDFNTLTDTLGENVSGDVWITLRPDTPAGIGLGGGRSIGPGQTGRVPTALAHRLVRNGKATYAEAPRASVPAPEVTQVADPEPATREPAPARHRGGKGRR